MSLTPYFLLRPQSPTSHPPVHTSLHPPSLSLCVLHGYLSQCLRCTLGCFLASLLARRPLNLSTCLVGLHSCLHDYSSTCLLACLLVGTTERAITLHNVPHLSVTLIPACFPFHFPPFSVLLSSLIHRTPLYLHLIYNNVYDLVFFFLLHHLSFLLSSFVFLQA